MESTFIVGRLGSRRHRDKKQDNDQVAADAVVLVNGLGVIDAAVQGREVKLGKADEGLNEQ